MRSTKRDQTAFDGVLAVLKARRCSEALRGNGAYGCQRVLDPVVQFFQNEFLQLVGSFTFPGVDARLSQQNLRVDACLLKQ